MYRTANKEGSDLHPALRDLGCVHFYGGWNRRFDANVKIKAPLWVGMNVSFRSSSKVLGPSLIDSNVMVGTSAIVNRSIVCRDTQIGEAAQVADSFIGRRVLIGPSVHLEHKPFPKNGKEIGIRILLLSEGPGCYTIARRSKCGAVIGDDCQIGRGATLAPGTILLPGCIVPKQTVLKAGVYRPQDIPFG